MDANRDPRTYIWRGSDIYGNTIQYALTQRDANDPGDLYIDGNRVTFRDLDCIRNLNARQPSHLHARCRSWRADRGDLRGTAG